MNWMETHQHTTYSKVSSHQARLKIYIIAIPGVMYLYQQWCLNLQLYFSSILNFAFRMLLQLIRDFNFLFNVLPFDSSLMERYVFQMDFCKLRLRLSYGIFSFWSTTVSFFPFFWSIRPSSCSIFVQWDQMLISTNGTCQLNFDCKNIIIMVLALCVFVRAFQTTNQRLFMCVCQEIKAFNQLLFWCFWQYNLFWFSLNWRCYPKANRKISSKWPISGCTQTISNAK